MNSKPYCLMLSKKNFKRPSYWSFSLDDSRSHFSTLQVSASVIQNSSGFLLP